MHSKQITHLACHARSSTFIRNLGEEKGKRNESGGGSKQWWAKGRRKSGRRGRGEEWRVGVRNPVIVDWGEKGRIEKE